MKIIEFFKNLLNSLLDGSFERVRIIKSMNEAFHEYYVTGEIDRLCKVSITSGNQSFRHEMSTMFFRSGFRISIENDNNVRESELRDISQYILTNTAFVRQLMTLGFDTLIVSGRTTNKSLMYSLKEYTNLTNFFIE
jgi:hypothetical protein